MTSVLCWDSIGRCRQVMRFDRFQSNNSLAPFKLESHRYFKIWMQNRNELTPSCSFQMKHVAAALNEMMLLQHSSHVVILAFSTFPDRLWILHFSGCKQGWSLTLIFTELSSPVGRHPCRAPSSPELSQSDNICIYNQSEGYEDDGTNAFTKAFEFNETYFGFYSMLALYLHTKTPSLPISLFHIWTLTYTRITPRLLEVLTNFEETLCIISFWT